MGISECFIWYSIIKAKIFPSATGVLLIAGTLIIPIAYLSGFSVKVAAVGATTAAIGQIWLGFDTLRILKKNSL
jgi:hypothetical protein